MKETELIKTVASIMMPKPKKIKNYVLDILEFKKKKPDVTREEIEGVLIKEVNSMEPEFTKLINELDIDQESKDMLVELTKDTSIANIRTAIELVY
ncbi:MAG: hypothetical protein J6I84_03415 [Bacilli bacterium]|nr:hypothetical protein [Bacilli bacterium]